MPSAAYLQTTFLSFFDPRPNKSVILDPVAACLRREARRALIGRVKL